MNSRTLAIGDVHGCLDELRELLGVFGWDPTRDVLVFLGDLVDRGPKPAQVVEYIMGLQKQGPVHVCLGNHDEKLGRWFRREEQARVTGKPNPMRRPPLERLAEWEALTPEQVRWVQELPVLIEPLPGWIAVHAGFEGKPREQQRPDSLIRVRWVHPETGKMAPLGADLDQPPGSVHWSELWEGPENVVYGHAVHSMRAPRVDRPRPGVECWGIDTGACFGGRLTALCLETREIFQVDSHGAYAQLNALLRE